MKDYSNYPDRTEGEWLDLFKATGHPHYAQIVKFAFGRDPSTRDQSYTLQIELHQRYDELLQVFENAKMDQRMSDITAQRQRAWEASKVNCDLSSADIDELRAMAKFYHSKCVKLSLELHKANETIELFVDAQEAKAAADKAISARLYRRQLESEL